MVVTSDRGLCGGFNANVNRYVELWHKENHARYERLDWLFVGRKGAEYFRVRKYPEPKRVILNLARQVSYTMAARVADDLMTAFASGGYDEVRLVYNEF